MINYFLNVVDELSELDNDEEVLALNETVSTFLDGFTEINEQGYFEDGEVYDLLAYFWEVVFSIVNLGDKDLSIDIYNEVIGILMSYDFELYLSIDTFEVEYHSFVDDILYGGDFLF